ncbi:MAG TPA: ABC-2 family transporter protein [Chthoniobacteraceae bacterium]|jgi:ABC-2 type transport system permease protein|nr:ABC-2 family transporter protein [Chthoniobacteraceae bacterium]
MNLGKYAKVFDIGLQNTFVYRWNFLLRSLFGMVPLAGTVLIWRSIFHERGSDVAGYDYRAMVWYFVLTVLVDNLITPTEDEWQIAADIREGQMSAFLVKPVNYLAYRLSLYGSYRLLYTIVTVVPVAVLVWYFRSAITLPASPVTWPLSVVSLAMAGLIQFFIAYALAMLAFWILEISTIVFILYSFEYFLSGHIFPLDIMPAWIQGALRVLPFPYEMYFPIAIFLGKVQGGALWSGLAIQTGWLLITGLAARTMFRSGVRHYQAVGG